MDEIYAYFATKCEQGRPGAAVFEDKLIDLVEALRAIHAIAYDKTDRDIAKPCLYLVEGVQLDDWRAAMGPEAVASVERAGQREQAADLRDARPLSESERSLIRLILVRTHRVDPFRCHTYLPTVSPSTSISAHAAAGRSPALPRSREGRSKEGRR